MSFIRIFPLTELHDFPSERFGYAEPTRCQAQSQFGACEYFLNLSEIQAFEQCPLYLVSEAETDALVDGIRIRLKSGEFIVIADDAEDENEHFLPLLQRASQGEMVEMAFSSYLQSLARSGRGKLR